MDKTQWNERIKLIEAALLKELGAETALVPRLAESMEYSLMAGGKRLRPILVMAAADAVGARGTDFVQAACGIEMIHTYSLIHDDLPAMDNDDYRRGKLTNHKVFGEALAILAGDALLTQAFEVILRQQGVPAQVLLEVLREMSIAAGPNGMVGGQVIDMLSEGKRISMEELRKMHMGKTGALFRAAIRSGAILGGASEAQLAALTTYADCFGLAFQITDDILDVVGDEAVIGKPVGSDERNEKSTYVTLTSLDEAKKLAADTVQQALEALEIFGDEAKFLRDLVKMLLERNK
ncbi:MAG: farnesyl diphosphate synthase [Anaerovibrio sp.]|uniref:Farnesyl diphosphate synthase n=2 Tax=Anaerovibrio slackiae TaxID=2652309 RepID=A0A6I2UC95_9FIRM|nr:MULTISPECIES: farnesyl diphosphate synthase [Anaerovibrio]MBQ2010570.1 polyprenyl synthetase family protein [Selenomonadaceae bacterium]MBQ5586390.1 polyprenyl synthetase family protein [Selenomonadaceae bacterium]MBQ5733079.1 polyprenyl synthetase family protein [Selenomonadaceae bacterium]MBQ5919923.1 polyprenyl synthetase family protein [Selenomonadaceae bacterium]MDD6164277.1 polyprenyl synthetase family protein [Anaerovibrio slackiae]